MGCGRVGSWVLLPIGLILLLVILCLCCSFMVLEYGVARMYKCSYYVVAQCWRVVVLTPGYLPEGISSVCSC